MRANWVLIYSKSFRFVKVLRSCSRDIFAGGRNRHSVHVAGTCKIVLQRFYGAVAGNAAAGLPTDRTCRALLNMAAYHA